MLTLLFLASLTQDVDKLIEELGSNDAAARDKAEHQLRKVGPSAAAPLKKLVESSDPELKARAQRLLEDPAFLSVDDAVREPLSGFGSDKEWQPSIEKLLRVDRKKLAEALTVCVKEGRGLVKFRAEQLVAVLANPPQDGLVYGIVLERPTFKDAPPAGVEIWLNVSDRERSFQKREGTHLVVPAGGGKKNWPSLIACGEPEEWQSFSLKPGACRVAVRQTFAASWHGGSGTSDTLPNGRFTVQNTYGSAQPEKKQDNLWSGSVTSNTVEFRIGE